MNRKIPAPAPGIYYDIPAPIYHSWDAISSTLLKNYASNPSSALALFTPSDDVNVGSGIHAYSLQGYVGLYNECAIMPVECEGVSKAAKEAREVFSAMNPGKALLPPRYGGTAENKLPMMEILQRVDIALKSHPKVAEILDGAQFEVSLVWVDVQSGCVCKARLDILAKNNIIYDLKKTKKIGGLKWDLDGGFNYRLQAAHYLNGAEACGLDPVAFGFIPCEAFSPFNVKVIYSDPDKTALAQEQVVRLIGLVKESKEEDYWPNIQPPVGLESWENLAPDDLVEVW